MVLSVPYSKQELEAIKIEKIAWFYVCETYDELRKLEGCSGLDDLSAVIKDLEAIHKIADAMGISNDAEHRIV